MPDMAVIMLVEDRDDDVLLVRKSLERAWINNPLQVVRNGEEAMNYLAGEGRYSRRTEYPLPDLILLDLKLPGIDGFEVLQWIRRQPDFGSITVVVLTSSDAIRDVNRAYALGANSFLVKPLEFENFVETARILKTYWLKTNKRPETTRGKERGAGRTETSQAPG